MTFLYQCLIFLFLFVLSVPLHEFGHLLSLKFIGGSKTKFKVNWLTINFRLNKKFGVKGNVKTADGTNEIHVADFWGKYWKIPACLSLLFGGWGSAVLLFILSRLATISPHDFHLWRTPMIVVIVFHLIYGLGEAVRGMRRIQLVSL